MMNLIIMFALCNTLAIQGLPFDEITLTQKIFDECSTCDARADRAANSAVATALREFMETNHVKLAIESGDVVLTENLPNQKIDTGHSCSKTAEARDGKISAKMVGSTAELDSLDIGYYQPYSFMAGLVPHEVKLNANIRVNFGFKFFGSCKRIGRKTCSIEGSSKGQNSISVFMSASDVSTETIDGQHRLKFLFDVTVIDEGNADSYQPMTIPKGKDCDILGGLGSINSYIKKYADKFLDGQTSNINELRGSKLVKKLEEVLKAKLGTTISIPIKPKVVIPIQLVDGRKKRSVATGCKRMECPWIEHDFTRVGNTGNCAKFMGRNPPDCSVYGPSTTVKKQEIGQWTFYLCVTGMVPA